MKRPRCETLIPYGTRVIYGSATVLKNIQCPRPAVPGERHCVVHLMLNGGSGPDRGSDDPAPTDRPRPRA